MINLKVWLLITGRLYNHKFNVDNVILESVRQYKCLGVLFCLNGSFTNALTDMYHRGQKAFFKVCSTFSSLSVNIDHFIHIYLTILSNLCYFTHLKYWVCLLITIVEQNTDLI